MSDLIQAMREAGYTLYAVRNEKGVWRTPNCGIAIVPERMTAEEENKVRERLKL